MAWPRPKVCHGSRMFMFCFGYNTSAANLNYMSLWRWYGWIHQHLFLSIGPKMSLQMTRYSWIIKKNVWCWFRNKMNVWCCRFCYISTWYWPHNKTLCQHFQPIYRSLVYATEPSDKRQKHIQNAIFKCIIPKWFHLEVHQWTRYWQQCFLNA